MTTNDEATGELLAKPVQCGAIVDVLGGFAAIRVYHFAQDS